MRISNKVDNHISNSVLIGTKKGVDIPTLTLQKIITDQNLTEVAFVKMNIEGAERMAIRGVGSGLIRIAHFAVSCHDFVADRDRTEELRTREEVTNFFEENDLHIERRSNDTRPWVRDYIYAKRQP